MSLRTLESKFWPQEVSEVDKVWQQKNHQAFFWPEIGQDSSNKSASLESVLKAIWGNMWLKSMTCKKERSKETVDRTYMICYKTGMVGRIFITKIKITF